MFLLFISTTDIVFPLSTLEVLKSIEPVVGPWYRLGLELGLTNGTLETIEHNHQRDVETCKRRMVREWLKKPQATWRSLELALLKVGEEEAAADVAEEHSDGKMKVPICSKQQFVVHPVLVIGIAVVIL